MSEQVVTRAEFEIVCDLIEIIFACTEVPERMNEEAQNIVIRFGHMRGQISDAEMNEVGLQ